MHGEAISAKKFIELKSRMFSPANLSTSTVIIAHAILFKCGNVSDTDIAGLNNAKMVIILKYCPILVTNDHLLALPNGCNQLLS